MLKRRFAYMRHQPSHDIETQARIVLACCAILNFLRIHDAHDLCDEYYFSNDDEVNLEHVEPPKDDTPNAPISFAEEAAWATNRDTMGTQWLMTCGPLTIQLKMRELILIDCTMP